jgi:hypothetical protein
MINVLMIHARLPVMRQVTYIKLFSAMKWKDALLYMNSKKKSL